jgi:WhiB family transcriptional regulator, redox-sensing transcriptional regulator
VTGSGWRLAGACATADPDLFIDARRQAAAVAVCAACPVRRPCLEFALATGPEFGVWAGLTQEQLRALRRGLPHRGGEMRVSRPRGPYRKKAA